MSLNKTLDRLFDEIRREARRNKDFADRLDAVLQAHASRRDGVPALEDLAPSEDEAVRAPAEPAEPKPAPVAITAPPAAPKPAAVSSKRAFNPVGLYLREGEEALAAKLGEEGLPDLLALVREHNLDPSGEAETLDRESLAAHVLAQAKRRAERDKKLFDY